MWFDALRSAVQEEVQNRCEAFLHALLCTTLSYLQKIYDDKRAARKKVGLESLASEFRDKMAEGRTFAEHGPYCTTFYDDVFSRAQKVLLPSFPE